MPLGRLPRAASYQYDFDDPYDSEGLEEGPNKEYTDSSEQSGDDDGSGDTVAGAQQQRYGELGPYRAPPPQDRRSAPRPAEQSRLVENRSPPNSNVQPSANIVARLQERGDHYNQLAKQHQLRANEAGQMVQELKMKNQQLENKLKQANRAGRPAKGQAQDTAQSSKAAAAEARLNDSTAMVADIGRRFMALYEAWPDSWWWHGGRPSANIVEKMRYDKSCKDLFKECIRSELWSLVPPGLHAHIELSKEFQSQFTKAGRAFIRMQVMGFRRDTARVIFSDLSHLGHLYLKDAHQQRGTNDEFKKKVTWPESATTGKKKKFYLLPIHFPDGKRDMRNVFRCPWIAMIIRNMLFGRSAVEDGNMENVNWRPSASGNGLKWKLKEVTPGLVALASMIGVLLHMGDKKLDRTGMQSGFSYYDAFAFYKSVINEPLCLGGEDEKWALELLAWLNGLVFPREFADGDGDSEGESVDEREEVRIGRMVRKDMEESGSEGAGIDEFGEELPPDSDEFEESPAQRSDLGFGSDFGGDLDFDTRSDTNGRPFGVPTFSSQPVGATRHNRVNRVSGAPLRRAEEEFGDDFVVVDPPPPAVPKPKRKPTRAPIPLSEGAAVPPAPPRPQPEKQAAASAPLVGTYLGTEEQVAPAAKKKHVAKKKRTTAPPTFANSTNPEAGALTAGLEPDVRPATPLPAGAGIDGPVANAPPSKKVRGKRAAGAAHQAPGSSSSLSLPTDEHTISAEPVPSTAPAKKIGGRNKAAAVPARKQPSRSRG